MFNEINFMKLIRELIAALFDRIQIIVQCEIAIFKVPSIKPFSLTNGRDTPVRVHKYML